MAVGLLALAALLLFASSSRAAYIHKPAGTFQLQSLQSGQPGALAVDEETDSVYVMQWTGNNNRDGWIEKFDADGNPSNFSGLTTEIPPINESQTISFQGSWANGDTFTLTCPNSETTAAIEWQDFSNLSALQSGTKSALESKCGGTFSVGCCSFNLPVTFEGIYAQANEPQMVCTKVTGSGTCSITNEQNGAPGATVHDVLPSTSGAGGCGQGCYQIAVDNSGGANQGAIYVSSSESMTTCCPNGQVLPNSPGGIHAYLKSGAATHSYYEGNPIDPNPFDGIPVTEPGAGGIFVRSQKSNSVRACGVTVDEDGNLIVMHGDSNTEYSYLDKLEVEEWATHDTQEPTFAGTINVDTSGLCKAQMDSAGNIYLQNNAGFNTRFTSGTVKKYGPVFHDPNGEAPVPAEFRDKSLLAHAGPDVGFGLDAEDNLYGLRPSSSGRVEKLDQLGSVREAFGGGEFLQPADIAVNKSTGTVYVTDGSFSGTADDVHIFKAFVVPNSLTERFSGATPTTGTLSGEVDLAEGGEEVTNCEFEYTTQSLYNSQEFGSATSVPCEEGTTFTANESVSAPISGLTMEQAYVFRLVTENANGASNGTVRKFVPHAVVDLTTKAATGVEPRSATLHASFLGSGDETEYWFEYGNPGNPAGVYPNKTTVETLAAPNGAQELSMPLAGLELESTYHFRIVAKNSTGESKGEDEVFTTPPAVFDLTTKPATEIGQDSITLNASYTGTGHDTHYYFEYGPTKSYGSVSNEAPGLDDGVKTGATNISAPITDYYGYTTYHYRVVAENEFGKTVGKDMTVKTLDAPVPDITETTVSEVTPTTAKFSAQVAPNRWDASWFFEWGETTDYGSLTELEDVLIGKDLDFQPIEATIEGLKPATVYHYRAVAFNFTDVTNGPDGTFITPDAPKVESSESSGVTETAAHLSSRVTANSSPTTVRFEYGTSGDYGSATDPSPIGNGTIAKESSADLTGLAPGTTYHYRVATQNEWGTSYGRDETFTTSGSSAPPPPPDCSKLTQLANKNAKAAKRLRKKAKSAGSAKLKRKLNGRASNKAKKARSFRARAKACSVGGGGK
jgi:hypothetical protein